MAGHPLTGPVKGAPAAKGNRDFVAFTNERFLAVNVQGITGSKKDFTSLPLSKIQAFSIQTAGTFDRDCELDLWFSGLGTVRLEFSGKFDIAEVARLVGAHVLNWRPFRLGLGIRAWAWVPSLLFGRLSLWMPRAARSRDRYRVEMPTPWPQPEGPEDRQRFELDDRSWDAFQALLERPSQASPRLGILMRGDDVFVD